MTTGFVKSGWRIASFGTFLFLLATIFVTELAVMGMGRPLLVRLNPVPGALLDAGILVTVFSLPLLLYCQRLRSEEMGTRQAIWTLYFKVLGIIFLVEFGIMLLLSGYLRSENPELVGLADAFCALMLSAPPLWLMFRRLELRYRRVTLSDYLNNPPMLYLLLLVMVFLADLQQELLLPLFLQEDDTFLYKLANSVLTTLFIAPVLWLLVARPLRRSAVSEQARARAVYAQVNDAVITFDGRGRIDNFNPEAERIFGYRPDEIIGENVARLFSDGLSALHLLVDSGELAGELVDFPGREMLGRRKDGTHISMDVSLSRMQLLGKSEFLLIMRDISDRRLAEEQLQASEARFREIFEQTDDAIIFLHPRTLAVIDINRVTEEMFGFSWRSLSHDGLRLMFPEEEFDPISKQLLAIFSGESLQLENLAGHHFDGREIIVSMRAKLATLRNVEILYCTLRDVTQRVQLESEAREIQSKLIHANKMTSLGLMVSGVAHEINNPNNFILTNARMLSGSWQDALKILREYAEEHGEVLLGGIPLSRLEKQSGELFDGILDGSRRISEIVNNLKGFARQESVELDGLVDMNKVAESAVSILRHEIVRFTNHFKIELQEGLPLVGGNRQMLGQVVVNLLMNACQALPDKNRGVELRTLYDWRAGEAVLTVADQGSGIPAETARRIMDPFFTTKLDSGGTGLGLSICRSIVKDHQGNLEFTTKPGVGTTFFIRLPVKVAQKGVEHNE